MHHFKVKLSFDLKIRRCSCTSKNKSQDLPEYNSQLQLSEVIPVLQESKVTSWVKLYVRISWIVYSRL